MFDIPPRANLEDIIVEGLMTRYQLSSEILIDDNIHPNLTYVKNAGAHPFSLKPMIRLLVKPLRDENGGEKPFTLINIEKHIEFQAAYEIRIDSSKYVGGVLNLLKLPNLEQVYGSGLPQPVDKKFGNRFNLALSIVNKHLHNKDIFACQEDLIDAGLKDYAEFSNSY